MAAQDHAAAHAIASARIAVSERSDDVVEDVIVTLSARALGDRASDCSAHREVLLQAMSWLSVTQQTLTSAKKLMDEAAKSLRALEVLKLEALSLSGTPLAANQAAQREQSDLVQTLARQVEYLVNDGLYGSFRQGVRVGSDTGYTPSQNADQTAALSISYQSLGDVGGIEIHATEIHVDDMRVTDLTSATATAVALFYDSVMDRVRTLRQAEDMYQILGSVLQIRENFCLEYADTLDDGATSLRQISVYTEATVAKTLQTRTRISMSALRDANINGRSNPAITAFG